MDEFIRYTNGTIVKCEKCQTELDVFCVCANAGNKCDNCCECGQH